MKRISHLLAVTTVAMAAISVPAQAAIRQVSGKLTLLRVHQAGTRYGPASDQIDADAIVHLSTAPGKAFGFQLRENTLGPSQRGMLDLLRDAFNHDWQVTIDYDDIAPGKNNGIIYRVWITK